VGLLLYRLDKIDRYTMCKRVALIACLLLADAAYLAWLPTDQTIWSWNWVGPHIGSASCAP
jgi:hypothetical protein